MKFRVYDDTAPNLLAVRILQTRLKKFTNLSFA